MLIYSKYAICSNKLSHKLLFQQKKTKILKIDSDWMNSFHTQITTKKNSWVNFYGLHNFGLEVHKKNVE